jgi:hypothetical protein
VVLVILLLAFVVILAGAELFTNGIEWFGRKLDLAEGAVGSVLAAVGTALPETTIPFIAIVFGSGHASTEVGVGAVLGAPFMLGTLAMCVTGLAVLGFRNRRDQGVMVAVDRTVLLHDLRPAWRSSCSGSTACTFGRTSPASSGITSWRWRHSGCDASTAATVTTRCRGCGSSASRWSWRSGASWSARPPS